MVFTRCVDCAAVGARHLAADQRHRSAVLCHCAGDVDFGVCGRLCLGRVEMAENGNVWMTGDGEDIGENTGKRSRDLLSGTARR